MARRRKSKKAAVPVLWLIAGYCALRTLDGVFGGFGDDIHKLAVDGATDLKQTAQLWLRDNKTKVAEYDRGTFGTSVASNQMSANTGTGGTSIDNNGYDFPRPADQPASYSPSGMSGSTESRTPITGHRSQNKPVIRLAQNLDIKFDASREGYSLGGASDYQGSFDPGGITGGRFDLGVTGGSFDYGGTGYGSSHDYGGS